MSSPTNKPFIVIIGGGIAGLSAGVYAQMHGFESVILERHIIAGGECTGWQRQGFHIDNCIHWMTGTSPKKSLYKVWCNVGALGEGIDIVQHDSFMRVDDPNGSGQSFQIWCDLQRMEKEMLEISPEDADAIHRFMDAVGRYQDVDMPCDLPPEERSLWWKLKALWHLRRVGKVHRRFSAMNIQQIAGMFTNEHIRQSMLSYLPDSFVAEALLYMYATFTSGNGAIPKGGSLKMIQRMQKRYEDLGGEVRTRSEAVEILTEGNRATGVLLKDGTVVHADLVIAACDPEVTYRKLLTKAEHRDEYFLHRYEHTDQYPVFSHMEIFFGSDVRIEDDERLPGTIASWSRKPIRVVGRDQHVMLTKHYRYEEDFAPQGQMVLQVMLQQNGEDFDAWKRLRETDVTAYHAEKQRVAEEVRSELEQVLPDLQGHLKIVEVVTPYSFHRFCGAHRGCYMPFIMRHDVKKTDHNGRIPNLSNGYLAGQWLQQPGGLPNAVITGKFAIQRICKDLGRDWKW